MNDFDFPSDGQLDRLVDDELSELERRDVLLALERESDGWLRLALAFVESQVLRREFRSLSVTTARSLPFVLQQPVVLHARQSNWRVAAIAALCCLVTFGLGRWSSSSSVVTPQPELAQTQIPQTYQAPNSGEESQQALMGQSEFTGVEQRTMRLELEDREAGEVQTIDVPVVEQANVEPEDLLKGPSVISEAVKRALLLSGRRVHEQRQVYEIQLDDGRCGIVPISEVRLENAGWDVFQ